MDLTWKHLHASVTHLLEASLAEGVDEALVARGVQARAEGEALPDGLAPHASLVRQMGWLLFGRLPEVDAAASAAAKTAVSEAATGEGSLREVMVLAWCAEKAEQTSYASAPAQARSDHFYNRAVGFGGSGDLLSALADVNAALDAVPDDKQALLNRGTWRVQLEDPEGAAADWTQAVTLDPSYALGWLKLGALKLAHGVAQGREDVERSLALAPADWEHRAEAKRWLSGE